MLLNLPKRIIARMSGAVMRPESIISQLELSSTSRVLELGRPIGFFAHALHNVIGDQGLILIAGPNNESLEKLHDEIEHVHTKTTSLSDVLGGRAAPERSLDLILLTNLLSSVAKAENFCLSIDRYLKPSGKIVVIDWQDTPGSAPTSDQIVSRESAISLLQSCNLTFERMLNASGYHYGLVFSLPKPVR